MQNLIRVYTVLLFITISLPGLWSQQSVHAAGGDATGTEGTVSFSIGQVAYTSVSNEAGQVSQGVQQSNLVIMVGQDEPLPGISVTLNPNPVRQDVFLQLAEDYPGTRRGEISLSLYDIYGSLLLHQIIVQESTTISLDKYPDGMYIVKVVRDQVAIKSFKVVKTN